jgi:hypothetical protein
MAAPAMTAVRAENLESVGKIVRARLDRGRVVTKAPMFFTTRPDAAAMQVHNVFGH